MNLRSMFSSPLTALQNLPETTASTFRSSRYQALDQHDVRDNNNAASGTWADAESTHAGDATSSSSEDVYRDAAASMLIKLGHDPAHRIRISPETNARVLRRIDVALLPLMLIVYFLHALDKATLSYASIFGLIDDTGLEGDQFSWLGSVVYLAQLIFQLPVALALVKLPIGKFTSIMVLGWGLTLTCMTKATNFHSLLVARFILGAFEASIGPSFLAITQMWWRRREQTLRVGSWYGMNGLTWVFGSLITYGLASIESDLKPYQVSPLHNWHFEVFANMGCRLSSFSLESSLSSLPSSCSCGCPTRPSKPNSSPTKIRLSLSSASVITRWASFLANGVTRTSTRHSATPRRGSGRR